MNEHRIRLRGGWRWHPLSDDPSTARPITLPTDWTSGQTGPVRMIRQFGLPAIDRARETVVLRVEGVPGLLAIRLNDRAVALPEQEWDALELREDQLASRNALVLDVDPARASAQALASSGWGHVALVVRPLDGTPG